MRVCVKCGLSKPLDEFYSRPGKVSGKYFSAKCKRCEIALATQRGTRKERRRRHWINRYKTSLGCSNCGFNAHPVALEFHHHDDNKEAGVHSLYTSRLTRLTNEIRKCTILCCNCHRITHSA